MSEKIRVLVVEPIKRPYIKEISHTLEEMQKLVGGCIQVIYPFDDPVALICNDEGKLMGLPYNRLLRSDDGVPYDIICGNFFVCGLKENELASISPALEQKYMRMYDREQPIAVSGKKMSKQHKEAER